VEEDRRVIRTCEKDTAVFALGMGIRVVWESKNHACCSLTMQYKDAPGK
jgi:hypothetical protein